MIARSITSLNGSEPTVSFHFGVSSVVQKVRFGLYRDFPDPQRQRGTERF
jgi:hypothetical protein